MEAGQTVARDINVTTGNPTVTIARLDLADIASVDAFVAEWGRPLDILINNAGVTNAPKTYTDKNGWELQFAVNHLGHFALATGLHPALKVAPTGARIVSVVWSGHGSGDVDSDNLFFQTKERPYDAGVAYGQSKTAQIFFAVEANRRWAEKDGITANALMPGGIWTNLQRYWDPDTLTGMKKSMAAMPKDKSITKTPEQGAATSVLLAASPLLNGIGGRYFDDCNEAPVADAIVGGLHGVRAYALDPARAQQL